MQLILMMKHIGHHLILIKKSYITFKLPFLFLLEGYTIQTSCKSLHLKTWFISASNNGINFTEEHKEEDIYNKLQNGNCATFYHSHAFFTPYKIYKIKYGSIYKSGSSRFDLNQIEFYGKIPENSCHFKNEKFNLSIVFILVLIIV